MIILVIVIDGAILFFSLIGAFSYLPKTLENAVLEWSIQIINAVFTLLCLIELPFRLFYMFAFVVVASQVCGYSSTSHARFEGFFENEDPHSIISNSLVSKCKISLQRNLTWVTSSMTFLALGAVLTLTKIIQIGCQFAVEYLCLAYVGRSKYRPSGLFAILIVFSLSLGCLVPAGELYLAQRYQTFHTSGALSSNI